jgi:Gpi18-like mannosyltransferase
LPSSGRSLGVRIAAALVVYVAARLALATTTSDPNDDAQQFKYWSLRVAHDGLSGIYRTDYYDYPPLYSWLLWPVGKLYLALHPAIPSRIDDLEALARLDDSTAFTILIKLPPLVFDLAIAALLVVVARGARTRSGGGAIAAEPRSTEAADLLPAAAWLLHPAILFDAGYWGQPDSVLGFFVLAALVAVSGGRRGAWGAWPLLALACAMKPLGAPFVPLLAVASVLRHGWRTTLLGMAAGAGAALLVFLPAIAGSGARLVVHRVLGDVGAMSWTSVQAHNLWWMVGPWRDAETAWLGPITPTQVGIALFLGFLAGLALRARRLAATRSAGLERCQLLALAGALAFGFFVLSTHMHENHAYAALPLLLGAIAAAPRVGSGRRELIVLFAAISAGALLNLAAHDPVLRRCWPFALGGPSGYAGDAPGRSFFVGEYAAGWIGAAWNLAALTALSAWIFGPGLRRLAWRAAPAAGDRAE